MIDLQTSFQLLNPPTSHDFPLVTTPFRGAFCIPDALPGIPYGDGKRIWTPAFGCYDDVWQDSIIRALQQRGYTWLEYQISGSPYHGDYPDLPVDVDRVVRDLTKIKSTGLGVIVAFDDTKGTDCSYLQPIADATQSLVDCVMGIYESNGVFDWDEDKVVDVLAQQHALWPRAINAFHSTTQDNGSRGFGESPFWNRVAPFVDVYFLQQSFWNHPFHDTIDRAYDFIWRLNNGHNGWPQLRRGVVLFEETTSVTYRGETEIYGTNAIDSLMSALTSLDPTARPKGYMDGGTVQL